VRRVDVFDTTLRDGEQSAGVNLHLHEKVEIAVQLERLGVDVMEAGFPASSQGDLNAVRQIARTVKDCSVAGLARALQSDIDKAWEALHEAAEPRLHIFLATSPIHMKYKLNQAPDEVVASAVASVRYAASKFPQVEWSAEDATRSDREFLVRIVEEVIQAGATVINLPDTVGYTTPEDYVALFQYIRNRVPSIHRVKLSAHCHDDLGMAVANSLAAIKNGVNQIEGTINGIGERAGNASLEEIAVALSIRKDFYQVETGLHLDKVMQTSKLVSKLSGMPVPPNKAVVGANAFAHESGIHQDGVLKNEQTYEIIRPEMVGVSSNKMVMGKHSGRHAFRNRCEELGLALDESQFHELFVAFKQLTEKKKSVSDDDILALVLETPAEVENKYELDFLHVSYSPRLTTTTLGVTGPQGTAIQEAATGNGSVEAIYNTIERVLGDKVELLDYRIQSTTGGRDSLAEVYVTVAYGGHTGMGRGIDNDVLVASAKSFLDAINRLRLKYRLAQDTAMVNATGS